MPKFDSFNPEANRETHREVRESLADLIREERKSLGKKKQDISNEIIGPGKNGVIKTKESGYQLRLRDEHGEEIHALKTGASVRIMDAQYIDRPDTNGFHDGKSHSHLFYRVKIDLCDTKYGAQKGLTRGQKVVEGYVSAEYVQVDYKKPKAEKTKEAPVKKTETPKTGIDKKSKGKVETPATGIDTVNKKSSNETPDRGIDAASKKTSTETPATGTDTKSSSKVETPDRGSMTTPTQLEKPEPDARNPAINRSNVEVPD